MSTQAGDSVNTTTADLVDGVLPLRSTITDSGGQPVAYLFDQNRQPLTADQISPAMKAAIVAIEDRRFYQHNGVDWQSTIRALIANSASGDVVQGASTLTQQYVKNSATPMTMTPPAVFASAETSGGQELSMISGSGARATSLSLRHHFRRS